MPTYYLSNFYIVDAMWWEFAGDTRSTYFVFPPIGLSIFLFVDVLVIDFSILPILYS